MELICSEDDLARERHWCSHFRVVSSLAGGPADSRFYLHYRDGVLALCRVDDPVGVFVRTDEIRRRLKGDFALGRACGIRRGHTLNILDATAGLGMDGLALALSGQHVVLVEREPVLWALLADLLARLSDVDASLILGDSAEVLSTETEQHFDVVYIDPMFPARGKTALPGKRMQYLSELLAAARPFDDSLVELAREHAVSRVVLKRRLKDATVGIPDWQIKGRSIRYDVYRGRAGSRGQPSRRMA